MSDLSTKDAATLAEIIYEVKNPLFVDTFLKKYYFQKPEKYAAPPHQHIKAEVGGRTILSHEDGFGVCAVE